MKVLFACAGTGGHVNPAIAIANILKEKDKNCQILFVGTKDGIENELIKKAGYDIKQIRTGKFLRKITFKNFIAIFKILGGISDSKKIIKSFKPDIVIGTGGYICGPVMYAAKYCKIPYILHESNSYPGVAVKALAKNAKYVFVGFSDAKKRLKNRENIVFTGTPTRFNIADIDNLNKDTSRSILKLSDEEIGKSRKIIFVTGGSQGARKFNEVVINMVEKYLDKSMYIVLVTGQKNYDEVMQKISKIENEDKIDIDKYICIKNFIYDMDKMYKASDLCITRSGAMTINELAVAAKPSILIPFPYATENHQLYNAKVLENVGAAKIIIESDLTEDLLYKNIKNIISNDEKLNEMGKNARKILKNDINNSIYNYIMDTVNRR